MRYLLFCYYSRYESLQPQLLVRALQRHQGHRLILTSHPDGMPCYDCFIVKLGAHLVYLFYNIIDLLIRDITCVVEFHISFCSAVDYCLDVLIQSLREALKQSLYLSRPIIVNNFNVVCRTSY
jgi:hypothetical protein